MTEDNPKALFLLGSEQTLQQIVVGFGFFGQSKNNLRPTHCEHKLFDFFRGHESTTH
jgi:hypothetical protein